MEEDAGKLLHDGFGWSLAHSGVDLNRAGVPLVEIVSRPELHGPQEAFEYLTALKAVLLYTGVSDVNMEEGSLRCDANVSLRPRGQAQLGTRVEIKNLNSFRHVARALEYEIERQARLLESGGQVAQETRLWNADRGESAPLRSKEEAQDYRYFPEPDLPPLRVEAAWLDELRRGLPELPAARRRRLVERARPAGLRRRRADPLARAGRLFRDRGAGGRRAQAGVELGHDRGAAQAQGRPAPARALPRHAGAAGRAAGAGRERPGQRLDRQGRVRDDVEERRGPGRDRRARGAGPGLRRGGPAGRRRRAAGAEPGQVASYRAGKASTLGWFVGQVMRRLGGQANPQLVNTLLRKALEGEEPAGGAGR